MSDLINDAYRWQHPWPVQIRSVRRGIREANQRYGSRLRTLDRTPEVYIVGRDRIGRLIQIQGQPKWAYHAAFQAAYEGSQ